MACHSRGLSADAVPIAGRIVAVVDAFDAFDAMTNDRPYRAACTGDEALAEIERCSGHHFDPHVAATFLKQHQNAEQARPLDPAPIATRPTEGHGTSRR